MKNTILAFLATVGMAITACDNAGNKSTGDLPRRR